MSDETQVATDATQYTDVTVPDVDFSEPQYNETVEAPQDFGNPGTTDIMAEVFPDTPELKVPPLDPEAHRGIITGVTRRDASTGSTGITFSLKSTDTGLETTYTIWIPAAIVDNVNVDPNTLSTEPVPGKEQSPKERYLAIWRNGNKTAEVQRILALAGEQDRHLPANTRPTDFDQFVAMMDTLLSGLLVVFTRSEEKQPVGSLFRPRLKVASIENINTAENPKKFKKFKKGWLGELS